jgi:hypothetical protein
MSKLPDYVDIGGECFNISGTSSYDLVCKSQTEFKKVFDRILTKPNDLTLLRQYLPHKGEQLKGEIVAAEKKRLITILQLRLDMLESSRNNSSNVVKNMQFNKYISNIKELLKTLKGKGESSAQVKSKLKSKIKQYTDEQVFQIVLELAWHLLHSDKITNKETEWLKLLEQMELLSLGTMIKTFNSNQHLKIADIDHIKSQDDLNDSYKTIDSDEAGHLRNRLIQIITLLKTNHYLTKTQEDDWTNLTKNPAIKDIPLSKAAIKKRGGGNDVEESEAENPDTVFSTHTQKELMDPFFQYFVNQFGIVSTILSKNIPKDASLDVLARLLYISQQIMAFSHDGIYRITNIDDILPILKEQLGAMKEYMSNAARTDEEKKECHEIIQLLPAVTVTSVINKFSPSKQYSSPDDMPILKYAMKEFNLSDTSEQPFVTDNTLYIICNKPKTTELPEKCYDIDFSSVDVTKPIPDPSPLEFTTSSMKLDPECPYNHSMLALSILLAWKELLP